MSELFIAIEDVMQQCFLLRQARSGLGATAIGLHLYYVIASTGIN
jgi:hypothetical protein